MSVKKSANVLFEKCYITKVCYYMSYIIILLNSTLSRRNWSLTLQFLRFPQTLWVFKVTFIEIILIHPIPGAGANPSWLQKQLDLSMYTCTTPEDAWDLYVWGGVHSGQVASSPPGRHTGTNSHSISHSPPVNLESPFNLTPVCMSQDCGRMPECPEKTPAGTRENTKTPHRKCASSK